MAFGSTILLASSSGTGGLNIIISADVVDYNVLTSATAAGYDNSTGNDTIITLTINSGVNVTASGQGLTALTTGALNANTTLKIINNGNIQGSNGASGGNGANGSSGGKGIFFNTLTGGSATHSIDNTNGTISGGGGGGGGPGGREGLGGDDDGTAVCGGTRYYGATGAVGGLGQNGANGGNASTPPANASCPIFPSVGIGGSGGDSIDKNGRTVSTSPAGTYNGSIAA